MIRYLRHVLYLVTLATGTASAAPRPNIILLMADDMGWGDPGYNSTTVTFADGSPHPDQGWIRTPTLDTMAANGVRFDRFYAASSVCSPTRASCLTGRNPVRVGIGNANSGRLGFDETPLSVVLSDVGYACGHFGKWHMGTLTTLRDDGNRGAPGNTADYSAPWHHQYDTCFATESKVPTYHPYKLATSFEDPVFYGTRYWRMPETWNTTSGEGDVVPVEDVNNPTAGDDSKLLVDQAIPFMRDAVASNTPFFLVLWFHTPHKPIIDPDGVSGVNSSDAARDAIEDLDAAVARVRDELTALGVRSNTMFWVTSDNGPENGVDSFNETEPGRSMRAGRYRDRKGTFYEGGIIVPGILEWPDVIASPLATDIPAVTSDYYPTILDYLELSVPDQKPLDGISLRPIIEGTSTRRAKPIGFRKGGDRAWIDNQYKLVDDGPQWELYDLVDVAPGDEPEQTPLATESNVGTRSQAIQDLYHTMLAEYTAWNATVNSDTPYIHASQPTVALSTPTNQVAGAFVVTATFSEDVSQLHAGEFAVDNGVASALTGTGTTWRVTITPDSPGAVSVALPEGCAIDADGTINAASGTLDITYANSSAPNVTLTTPADPVSTSFVVTATFSEDVTGLEAADFQVTNGSAAGLDGGPAVYTVTIQPTAPGTVSVTLPAGAVQDGETNGNNASSILNITYDVPKAPSVFLSGPAAVSASYSVSITFSEPVTGLATGDLVAVNGAASNLSGSGANYSVLITPSVAGAVSVTLPAGSVTDLDDGLGNTASTALVTTYTPVGGGTGTIVEVTVAPTAGQTVDSEDTVPGHGSNNLEKFTAGPYHATNLFVRASSNAERQVRAFTRFDLSSLAGQPIAYATLTFNGYSLNGNSGNATDLEAVALAADWSPSGSPFPTYTHATVGPAVNGGSVIDGLDADLAKDYSLDLTGMVRNWTDGTWTNHGLRIQLTIPNENNGVGIKTSGADAIQLLVGMAPLVLNEAYIGPGAADFSIEWNSVAGHLYGIEGTTALTAGWNVVTNVPGSPTGTSTYTSAGEAAGYSTRFFRVSFPAAP